MSLVKALFVESKGGLVPINPQVFSIQFSICNVTYSWPKPHAGRCSLNNMTTITFGFRTDSIEHPLVKQALKLSREFM